VFFFQIVAHTFASGVFTVRGALIFLVSNMAKESSSEVRTYTFPFQSENITIKYVQRETHKLEGVGVTLWPASLALCRFLVNKYGREYFQNARILEVGAGVGLLGIALAKISAEVVITDADEKYAPGVLELLRENASNNLLLDSDQVRAINFDAPRPWLDGSIRYAFTATTTADCQRLWRDRNSCSCCCTRVYVTKLPFASMQLRRCVQPLNWGEPFSDSIKPPYDV
jgi:hypothetical protein